SSSPSVPREAYVDDEVIVLVDGREQFTRQLTYPGIVEISRAELEQWVDRPVRVQFADRFGAVVGSDRLWLIWMN
ncbi:MAG TPA: hypothetical protein VGE07_28775, partial [Herpetosiphonaceae bacterium]